MLHITWLDLLYAVIHAIVTINLYTLWISIVLGPLYELYVLYQGITNG